MSSGISSWPQLSNNNGKGVSLVEGVSPTSYSALDLPGLNMWLKSSDVDTVSVSNGKVTQFNDKSGNSNNPVQETVTNQPAYSSPDMTFDGVDNRLVIANASAGEVMTANFHIFVVVNITDKGGSNYNTILGTQTESNGGYWINIASDDTIRTITGSTTDLSSTATITYGQNALISYSLNVDAIKIRLDGVEVKTGTMSGDINYPSADFILGSADWSTPDTPSFDGIIRECLYCSEEITGNNLSNIETLLMSEYGIS